MPTPVITSCLEQGDLGFGETLFLHMVDTVGVIHAIILRMQASVTARTNAGLWRALNESAFHQALAPY